MEWPRDLLDQIENTARRGEVATASTMLHDLIQRSTDAKTLCGLAQLANKLDARGEAIAAYRRAIRTDSALGVAYMGLAVILIGDGDYRDAQLLLEKALKLEPDEVAYSLLGEAFAGLGRNDEAKQNYERAIALDPKFEEPYYNFGVMLRGTEPDKAEKLFRQAIALDACYAAAHRELGWLLRNRSDLHESRYHLAKALELRPDDAWAHVYLGNVLWRAGEIGKALGNFRRATIVAPHSSFPFWALGNFYEEQDDWKQAQELYKIALDLAPDDVVANRDMGRLLKKTGDLQTARVYLERALLLDPDYTDARRLLAEIP